MSDEVVSDEVVSDEVVSDEKPKRERPAKPKAVKMVRDDGKTADVHPDEVENFKKGGYQVLSKSKGG